MEECEEMKNGRSFKLREMFIRGGALQSGDSRTPHYCLDPGRTTHVMGQPSQDGHAVNFQEACELWTRRGGLTEASSSRW